MPQSFGASPLWDTKKFKGVLLRSELRQEWVPHVQRLGDLISACLVARSPLVPPAGSLKLSPVENVHFGIVVPRTANQHFSDASPRQK